MLDGWPTIKDRRYVIDGKHHIVARVACPPLTCATNLSLALPHRNNHEGWVLCRVGWLADHKGSALRLKRRIQIIPSKKRGARGV
ncbi:MAG: hypothetical protein E3K40_01475 [Candidatus Brocadia sp.]|nr:hypothetical protein [Candidatus Brocadia sp.]